MTHVKNILWWVKNDVLPPYAGVSVQTERDREVQEAIGARKPEPVPATKQLRTNLERVTLAYNDRERVLVKEIAEREAELADVRRARDATTAALMELDVDAERVEEEISDALALQYGGARYVPHDAVRAATDRMQDAVEAARHE